jgi:hypothetical protein
MTQSQFEDAHRSVDILRRIHGCGATDYFDTVDGGVRREHKSSGKTHLIGPGGG